jgi:multidrug transporter EmrE-like cation transporter
MNPFVSLTFAIFSEIIATTSLKLSVGFTKPLPSLVVVIGYAFSFYMLSMALKGLPLGTAYAIWSAAGTVGTVILGVIIWKTPLNVISILGIALIVVGVVLLNLYGEAVHTA